MPNSKKKGSRNERSVSKLFAQWTGYEFARTPQSGGLHWQKQNTVGDIVCIDDKHGRRFPFSVECKAHAELDLLHLIDGTKGKKTNKVVHFWEQCLGDAEKVNKVPLLFMRRNGMKADTHFVVMPSNFFLLILVAINKNPYSGKYGYFHFISENYLLTVMNSEDFFDLDYSIVYKVAKKLNKHGKKEE